MLLLLLLVFLQAGGPQTDSSSPGYLNSDPPELHCGSFHARDIHGTVADPIDPLEGAEVEVFDDASQKFVAKTRSDKAGRFSFSGLPHGRYRVVLSAPGFLPENWAVTIVSWPDGGLFHSKALRTVLSVHRGDTVPICPPQYSRD